LTGVGGAVLYGVGMIKAGEARWSPVIYFGRPEAHPGEGVAKRRWKGNITLEVYEPMS